MSDKLAKKAAKRKLAAKTIPGWNLPDFTAINYFFPSYKEALMYGLNYANNCFENSELAKEARKYAQDKLNIDLSSVADMYIYNNGKVAWLISQGAMPDPDAIDRLDAYLKSLVKPKVDSSQKQTARRVSTVSTKETKTNECIGLLEGLLDDCYLNKKELVKQPKEIIQGFIGVDLAEIEDWFAIQQKDILAGGEGYENKKDIFIKIIPLIIKDVQSLRDTAKAIKKSIVRKPKKVSPIKMVSKLNYLKEQDGIKSIAPDKIIGTDVLWVYNVKTRKLGKYVAKNDGGLFVKGSTIMNYDEDKSVGKKLRKPEDALTKLMSCGKIDQRKLLDLYKTTEQKMNGRINNDTLLVKLY